MSEFEFLSILLSIIVGLGLTHILSGALRAIFSGIATESLLVYSLFSIMVMVLNWWTIFGWSEHQNWSFDEFIILVLWAISHYLIAITLYPPVISPRIPFESSRRWFLWAFFAMVILDIVQTAVRGDLFNPWYYLPFVMHFALLAVLGIYVQSITAHRIISWWFLGVTIIWSLVVRRFLV